MYQNDNVNKISEDVPTSIDGALSPTDMSLGLSGNQIKDSSAAVSL